eukprot:2512941-Rhodomonas_salina.4
MIAGVAVMRYGKGMVMMLCGQVPGFAGAVGVWQEDWRGVLQYETGPADRQMQALACGFFRLFPEQRLRFDLRDGMTQVCRVGAGEHATGCARLR